MYTIMEKVCPLACLNEYARETRSGYKEEEFSFLKALKGAFTWSEIKATSPGGCTNHSQEMVI